MSKALEPTDTMIEFVRNNIERMIDPEVDEMTIDALAVHKTAKFAMSWLGTAETDLEQQDDGMATMLTVYHAYWFDLHN